MRDLTFYLANMPPLPVPRLDVDIRTLYYRPIEAALTTNSVATNSVVPVPRAPETRSRLTEIGHSVDSGFVLSMCCC